MKKLVVFAHTPPPHHGQSYMVKLLLDGLRTSPNLKVYHVDARFASGLDDVGRARFTKIPLLLKYCALAIWTRLRHGARNFYYVPANPSRTTVYRDWLLMSCCSPFFSRRILHWHAAGLGEWLDTKARPWERTLTERLIGHPTLSIVLSNYSRRDGERLKSHKTIVVPNGIHDPCCGDAVSRGSTPHPADSQGRGQPKSSDFQVLFLGLCTRQKGLFDAVDAVELANRRQPGFRLVVAGTFRHESERKEFDERTANLLLPDGRRSTEYRGFVSGEEKQRLFKESNCFCFPTYYTAESFGLVLLEAMAYDLPIVATRWRMIPEVLPPKYPYLVEPQAPQQLAEALLRIRSSSEKFELRQHFLQNFTVEKFVARMEAALLEGAT